MASRSTGRVSHLHIAVASRQPMREVRQVEVVANKGFQGCVHGRRGSRRQVLLMDSETLSDFGLSPGIVKENITTEGIRIAEFVTGQRLRVSQVLLEVTGPCAPCYRMDEIRMGLQEELQGRRGILCRVIEGGPILQGDLIEPVESLEPATTTNIQGETRDQV